MQQNTVKMGTMKVKERIGDCINNLFVHQYKTTGTAI